ncbi:prolyl 4-hydroxylase subunit alpha-2-like isoform X2 [Drosophila serrata]|uniref:prolyl 4-hydroxylase subunit alpha-2-like isoform X2 n=1 Tax=Drosophila serrata TaxID=7274 RepID=UPI000A1D38FB|nr:prolyl 4-hydroxylase subunit alpha-2-like isoform X2 [Drosophila serrata]
MNLKWILFPGFFLILLRFLTVIQCKKQDKSHSFSVVTMVPLLKLEKKLIENLEDYAKAMDQKVQIIRSHILTMRLENNKAQMDAISYLSNPLNGFSLIRRLQEDWVGWRQYMNQTVGATQMRNLDTWSREFPMKEDLQDACEGIFRIQRHYDLKVNDIVGGKLQGRQHNVSMSSSDILAMGQYLLETSRPAAAVQWLKEVSINSEEDLLPEEISVRKAGWLQLLVRAHKQNQSYSDALDLLDNYLEIRPHDAILLRQRREIEGLKLISTSKETPATVFLREMATACNVTPKNTSRLYCFYNSRTTPFLRLAPLKVEQVGLYPYVLLYHQVLSTHEISSIIKIATKKMKRTGTVNPNSTTSQTHYRTAMSHWMAKMTSKLGQRINRRIRDMSGFDLKDSESFQIINYGIGGHYGPHYDYFNLSSDHSKRRGEAKILGDRIATVLFYLSDVEQGGATAFTKAGYVVYPRAGTALFWHNLDTEGNGDLLTRHTACTVISGSKWVMTEWIKERRQIFIRPCLPREKAATPPRLG